MDQPDVKAAKGLIFDKALSGGQIDKSPKRSGDSTGHSAADELLGGADKILHIMILLQGVPNSVNRIFLPADFRVTAKDLENAEPFHFTILFIVGRTGKLQGQRVGVAIFRLSG